MSKRKRRGHDEEVAETSAESAPAPAAEGADAAGRLMPVDIQQKEFRLAFRGYNEHDVDQFLDMVTEELARLHEETKRLSERLEEGGTGAYGGSAPGALIEDAQRRAEEIVREARDQASSILSQAGTSVQGELAAAPGPSASPGEIRAFLAREREFLQGLAGLIQQHAEAVKRDAQAARGSAAGSEGSPSAPQAEAEAERPAQSFSLPASLSEDSGLEASAPLRAQASMEAEESGTPSVPDAPGTDAWSGTTEESDPWASPETAAVAPAGDGPPSTRVEDALRSLRSGRIPESAAEDSEDALDPAPDPALDAVSPVPEETQSWTNPFSTRPEGPEPAVEPERPASQASLLSPSPPPLPPAVPEPPARPATAPASDRSETPATPPTPRSEGPSEETGREEDDRSLRELFWGEE